MQLNEYEACLAVARAGSFAPGARALGITASAMSQIIKRLETRVGVQLFHRTTRSVSPTDAGAQLVARLEVAFEEIETATRRLLRLLLPQPAHWRGHSRDNRVPAGGSE